MSLEAQFQEFVEKIVKEQVEAAIAPLKKELEFLKKDMSNNVGTEEALHILGVSESTLKRHRGDSAIIWTKVGKKDLYDRMSLYAFKEQYRMRDHSPTLQAASK